MKKMKKGRNVQVPNFKGVEVRFFTLRADVYFRGNFEGQNGNNLNNIEDR